MSKAEELVKATQEMPELESQATSMIRALVLLTNGQERTLCLEPWNQSLPAGRDHPWAHPWKCSRETDVRVEDVGLSDYEGPFCPFRELVIQMRHSCTLNVSKSAISPP